MRGVTPFDIARSAAPSRHIIEAAVSRGLTPEMCLAGTELSSSQLSDPDTSVRPEQELTIIRNVISHLDDCHGLGADAGRRYSLADTGILGYALIASRTFGDAVEVACRYFGLTWTYFRISAPHVTSTESTITFDHSVVPADLRTFLIERDIAVVLRLLPTLLGSLDSPVTVKLELCGVEFHAELPMIENLALGVERSDRNALSFPTDLMARPMPVADTQTAAVCIRQCEDLLNRRRVRRGISAAVRTRIIQYSNAIPSMPTIAAEFAMTERTLHRRLAAEGTSYRALLDEVRATLAGEMLDSGLTIDETARRLGYSETAAFTRAYTRWNDHPPSRRKTGKSSSSPWVHGALG